MRDPFASYDSWLEAPYRQRAIEAEFEEAAWAHFDLCPGDLEPPHKEGDPCPLCGRLNALDRMPDETGGVLYCTGCGCDVDWMEQPTFDPVAEAEEIAAEAAISRAEDRRADW